MMRSWTTPGSLLISQRIVVTREVAEKRGKFSDDPEELGCIQGSLNDFV